MTETELVLLQQVQELYKTMKYQSMRLEKALQTQQELSSSLSALQTLCESKTQELDEKYNIMILDVQGVLGTWENTWKEIWSVRDACATVQESLQNLGSR